MYTPGTALAAAVALGLIVVGLGCCRISRKSNEPKIHELKNVNNKYFRIAETKSPPFKFNNKA